VNINTSEAGYGNITCRIHSTSSSDVDIDIVDNGDGTVSLMYTPRVPGAYTLNIKFGGQPVPDGQVTQQVSLTAHCQWECITLCETIYHCMCWCVLKVFMLKTIVNVVVLLTSFYSQA
jgi:hypothetical protein